jgi:hypothetical protein
LLDSEKNTGPLKKSTGVSHKVERVGGGGRETMGKGLHCGFLRKERARQGKQIQDHFSGLWT